MMPTVFIAADHAGFDLKNIIREHLISRDFTVEDLGAHTLDHNDDYPAYAKAVAMAVREHPGSLGILSCGNAEGVMIVANKFDGIRAGLGFSTEAAITMRQDDNVNILCIPGRIATNDDPLLIVDAFIAAEFLNDDRHNRRLAQLSDIEKDN